MSVIFMEGFDAYGTSPTASNLDTYISRKWPTFSDPGPAFSLAAGRLGGRSWVPNQNRYIQSGPLGNNQDMTCGFAFYPINMADANQILMSFYDGATQGMNIRLTSLGELAVYLGSSVIATTSGLGLTLNSWHAVEFSVHTHNSTGTYSVMLNGNVVLSNLSGLDTQPGSNAYHDRIRVGPVGSTSAYCRYDDLYVSDSTTPLTAFKIVTLLPDDDDAVQFTPSTGMDNYAMVDDDEPDGDSTYVSAGAGNADDYTYPSGSGFLEVHGVMVNTICRVDDASPITVKQRANGSESAGQSVSSTSYVSTSAMFATNPDTSLPWEPAEIASATFGFSSS